MPYFTPRGRDAFLEIMQQHAPNRQSAINQVLSTVQIMLKEATGKPRPRLHAGHVYLAELYVLQEYIYNSELLHRNYRRARNNGSRQARARRFAYMETPLQERTTAPADQTAHIDILAASRERRDWNRIQAQRNRQRNIPRAAAQPPSDWTFEVDHGLDMSYGDFSEPDPQEEDVQWQDISEIMEMRPVEELTEPPEVCGSPGCRSCNQRLEEYHERERRERERSRIIEMRQTRSPFQGLVTLMDEERQRQRQRELRNEIMRDNAPRGMTWNEEEQVYQPTIPTIRETPEEDANMTNYRRAFRAVWSNDVQPQSESYNDDEEPIF